MAEATFTGSSGGETSFGSGGYKRPKSKGLSFQQMLALSLAAQNSKKRSFLGSIVKGGGHGLMWGFEQILRPSYGVAEGTRRALQGKGFDPEDFVKGFSRGVQLKRHTSFSEVLNQEGILKGHGKLRAVAGFGLDVVTDPTLPLQIGAIIATGGAAAPEIIAGRIALQTAARVSATAAAKHVAAKEAERTFAKLGEKFTAHKAVAQWRKIMADREFKMERGKWEGPILDEREQQLFSTAEREARREFEATGPKVLQASYKVPFVGKRFAITPARIGETRVAPKAFTLERGARGEGALAKIPGVKQTSMKVGKTFRHGFLEEEWQKPLLMASHMGEVLFDRDLTHGASSIGDALKRHPEMDNVEKQLETLDWAYHREHLINPADRSINEAELTGAIERQAINEGQADFIREWHRHTEYLRARDKLFNVKYDRPIARNKLYLPHIYTQHGKPLRGSNVSVPGFTKKRVADLTPAEWLRIHKLQKSGSNELGTMERNLITNPIEVMGIRTRRGAQAHAKETVLEHMRRMAGVPSRVRNLEREAKVMKKLMDAEADMNKWEWIYNPKKRAGVISGKVRNLKIAHEARKAKANEVFGKEVDELYGANNKLKPVRDKKGRFVDPRPKSRIPVRKYMRALERSEEKLARDTEKMKDEVIRLQEQGIRETEWAATRFNRASAILDRGVFKRNPNIPENWEKLERKIGGEHYHFPPELHQAMSRIEVAMRGEEEMEKLANSAHKLMAKWKVAVTSVNPGYRVRNTLSDMWNMYVSGVPTHAIVIYGARAGKQYQLAQRVNRKLIEASRTGEPLKLTKAESRAFQNFMDASAHGVMSGLFQGDVQLVSHIIQKGGVSSLRRGSTMLKEGRVIAAYARIMQDFNRHAENWGRFTHYLYRREGERMAPDAAADWVKKAHFDYSELTPIEREKFRMIIPFYTWSRKNIPYQIVQMFAHPGRMATFPKFVRTSGELATGETGQAPEGEGLMPSWLREKWAFQIPFFGKQSYMTPMIGVGDLARLSDNPVKEALSMAGPWVKMPYEIGTGRSLFTGEKINQGRREPIGGPAAALLQFIPGADVGKTARSPHGERIEGPGASPWVKYLAGQVPMLQTALQFGSPIDKAKRGQKGPLSLRDLAYFTGIPVYERDPETEAVIAQLEMSDQLKQVLKRLRDSGVISPPKRHKQSAYERRLLKTLGGNGG